MVLVCNWFARVFFVSDLIEMLYCVYLYLKSFNNFSWNLPKFCYFYFSVTKVKEKIPQVGAWACYLMLGPQLWGNVAKETLACQGSCNRTIINAS